ncbi:hypothetical protein CJ178_09645 [Rhodococcus sp. ACPA4]|nr:hypothetical protein CJ178_09645 [Rhodococcus sp. ACPA4]
MRSQSDDVPTPTPLGPDSLTWKYFGDWRGMLQGVWAGSMQNMHPGLGAGVEEHSQFFDERWERLYRSLYPIAGVVFDGDRAQETAEQVRGYHTTIKGVDKLGRRYHALDPDTFYWAHATFFMGTIVTAENFSGGLTEAQKRQLFTEHIQWYRLYGMSMRPVPETWEAFQEYWDHMCRNILEDNKATHSRRTRLCVADRRYVRPAGSRSSRILVERARGLGPSHGQDGARCATRSHTGPQPASRNAP